MPSLRGWRALFFVALVVGVFIALRPSAGSPPWLAHGDKIQHALAFAVFAWLGWRSGIAAPWALFAGLLAFGIGIEFAQSFTATRQAEFADVVADGLGVGLCLLGLHRVGAGRPGPGKTAE